MRFLPVRGGVSARSEPFRDEIDEALWDAACRRADGIREFLKHRLGKMTAADVALLATGIEISRATAYRLIKLFRAGGAVMSLANRKRGRPQGRRVDDQREQIIRTTIKRHYLTRNRPTVSQLVRDVPTSCMSAGLKPPHRRTINARLDVDSSASRSSLGRAGWTRDAQNAAPHTCRSMASSQLQLI
ncbi:transposase [Sinorhizobium meliloti]|uniref:transposase n=1 Tax=Rhizobium meliloti TaxID=382 RepID=UPI0013E3C57B|nr:transposase [Sinorhizobium meliloti]